MRVSSRFWRESAILGACACALGLGVWIGSQASWFIDRTAPIANGLVFENPRPISTFQLIDFDQGTFSVDQLKGRWSFIYFGYSTCGQVCTETLTELKRLILALSSLDNAQPIQIVFVTVDPGRDSASRLKTYLREFDSTFIGITGDINTLAFFAAELAAPFTLGPDAGESYALDHSNSIMQLSRRCWHLPTMHSACKLISVRSFDGGKHHADCLLHHRHFNDKRARPDSESPTAQKANHV